MRRVGWLILTFATPLAAQETELPTVRYPPLPTIAAKPADFISPDWQAVSIRHADFNRDGLTDVAMVLRMRSSANFVKRDFNDKPYDTNPYRMVIAFKLRSKALRLIVDNRKFFPRPEAFSRGDEALDADTLKVANGSLDLFQQYLRSNDRYRFRWSKGAFRLIGYKYVGSDGGCLTTTSIDFLTRRAMIEVEPLGEDGKGSKVIRSTRTARLLSLEDASADGFYPEKYVVGSLPTCP